MSQTTNVNTAEKVWVTPDAEKLVAYLARVSNPENQSNPTIEHLIKYLITECHWSPFEMVHACVEVNTTRDIGRQMLRHGFKFQEFSQRYGDVGALVDPEPSECRMQDTKNRQNSLVCDSDYVAAWWKMQQEILIQNVKYIYTEALKAGIAKEVARKVLPEGLQPSRMYAVGSLRTWIHYLNVRLDPSTQKEHRELAQEIYNVLVKEFPIVFSVYFKEEK